MYCVTLNVSPLEVIRDTNRDSESFSKTDLLRSVEDVRAWDEHEGRVESLYAEFASCVDDCSDVGVIVRVVPGNEEVALRSKSNSIDSRSQK